MRLPGFLKRVNGSLRARGADTGDGATYAAPVPVYGMFEGTQRLLRKSSGNTLTLRGLFYADPDATIAVGDRLTVAGVTYEVASVEPAYPPMKATPMYLEVGLV